MSSAYHGRMFDCVHVSRDYFTVLYSGFNYCIRVILEIFRDCFLGLVCSTGYGMTVTLEQLIKIMPYSKDRAHKFIDHINASLEEFDINTPQRIASFLAQIGHESGQLRYTKEIASGAAYEGRKDLGNTQKGDGVKFAGRGLVQITGRANYTACMLALDLDLLEHPELLETPENAARSAAWFWKDRGLNEIADTGNQVKICKVVNGGTNGLNDRLELFDMARKVLA